MREMAVSARDAFQVNYDLIMEGRFPGELIASASAAPVYDACRALVKDLVYPSLQILKLEIRGKCVLHDLMDFYWQGAKRYVGARNLQEFWGKMNELCSSNYRSVFEIARSRLREGTIGMAPETYYRLQLVTDQVCGMTDTFAVTLHGALTNG
jgi:dGTPase